MLDLSAIEKDWTLFLDRDGVINVEKKLDYIYHYGEFQFMPGVPESIKTLSEIFSLIIVVTNQRGVGKGLMTEEALIDLQTKMVADLKKAGGRIDAYYYCTSTSDDHPNRKPNPGMAFEAAKHFPAINLGKSLMVGNTISDMQFGRNAGMYTVHVRTTHPGVTSPHPLIDLSYKDLPEFTMYLLAAQERRASRHQ